MKDLGIILYEEILIESLISGKLNVLKSIKKKLSSKLRSANVDMGKANEMAKQVVKDVRPLVKEYKGMGPAGGRKLGQEIVKRSQAIASRNKDKVIKEELDSGSFMLGLVAFICATVTLMMMASGAGIPIILVPGVLTVVFGFTSGKVMGMD